MGLAQLSAKHFEDGTGTKPDEQTTNKTGTIRFDNVNTGYTITIDGTCAGTADATTNRTTLPGTPIHYSVQDFDDLFVIQ